MTVTRRRFHTLVVSLIPLPGLVMPRVVPENFVVVGVVPNLAIPQDGV